MFLPASLDFRPVFFHLSGAHVLPLASGEWDSGIVRRGVCDFLQVVGGTVHDEHDDALAVPFERVDEVGEVAFSGYEDRGLVFWVVEGEVKGDVRFDSVPDCRFTAVGPGKV